jgi:septum formation protein
MTAPAVYLASKSVRREELLRQLGVEFASLRMRESSDRERDIVEGARDAEPARHYVERIARTKATIGWQRMIQRGLPPRPGLGADT